MGLKYGDIVKALAVYQDRTISERHVKRLLKRMGLSRRKNYSDVHGIVSYIQLQLQESGRLHGYRWMTQKCSDNGFKCTQDGVRTILGILDPEGCDLRQKRCLRRRAYISQGPNYIWHFDSYDKIKRFGFCINGCTDGFSRRIIWLNCYISSNDPKIIGGYYVKSVQCFGGCPKLIRGDHGTENVLVRQIHTFFRRNGTDERSGERSYLSGPSTANQRIEYFWNFLRRQCMEFWMNHFIQLEADGDFDGSFLQINVLRYCYMHLIQVSIFVNF